MANYIDEFYQSEVDVRRKFIKTFLDLIVLKTFKNRQISGYEVITLVYDKFQVLLSPGTIYPVLFKLEKEGLVKVIPTKRKKMYQLTDKGERYADFLDQEYKRLLPQILL